MKKHTLSLRSTYFGAGDDLHFRKDIAVAAGDELLKALRRTALQKYPEMEGDDSSWDQLVIGIWPGLYAVHQFIV